MALFICGFALSYVRLSPFARRDAGPDSFGFQSRAIVVAIIAFITDHAGRVARKCRMSELSTDMVTHLLARLPMFPEHCRCSVAEAQNERPTIPITNGMEL